MTRRKGKSEELITQAEAARLRRVSREAIHALIKRGRLRAKEVAGRPMVFRRDVLDFKRAKTGPKPGEKQRLVEELERLRAEVKRLRAQ